jgi:hypothetical protein
VRIQTDIRAGTRTDKSQHFHEKVAKVEEILARDVRKKAEELADIDAEGNQGHVAGDKKVGRDEAEVVREEVKEAAVGTQVGPGKVRGSWASLLKQ